MENELRFAVLIDADNISDKYVKIIMDEIANSGIATYKRIYGDWTGPRLGSWKTVLLDNSFIPMQQYSYTYGKNATDAAMIIDAMDILYSGTVDGFCIVSSDSDFTRLAARLREAGMQVIGMGEIKTPTPFIAACNQFKYLDILYANQEKSRKEEEEKKKAAASKQARKVAVKNKLKEHSAAKQKEIKPQSDLDVVIENINAIMENFSDEEGWIYSGLLGNHLSKRLPDFDVRNFGYSKLSSFMKSLDDYEIDQKSDGNQMQIYYRQK
jgi:uncharacterized LabA/DUF88 family protein